MMLKNLTNSISYNICKFPKMFFSTNTNPQIDRKPKQQFMKVTQSAKLRISQLMKKKNNNQLIGVKIGLTKKGCNGLTYSMNYITTQNLKKFDQVVQLNNGIKVVIDTKAIMAIVGTQLDYVQTDIGSQFVFNNPNQKGRCGCGESFHI